MAKIILMRPKLLMENAMPNPPLGLGYIASILKAKGHEVELLDCAILRESYTQVRSRIKAMNPDVIGITALSSYYSEMRRLARFLHPLQIPIILGGIHVSALPELSLKECRADFVVQGEGELTTLELMDKWSDKEARAKIKGIAYLEKGELKVNPKRELIQNLDDLPFPDWELINPLKYPPQPHGIALKRYPVAPIMTSRGCPYSCMYCASTQFWEHKYRRRSAQNIGDELEYLVNKFKVREIHIWDDNFTLLRKHVIEFCREVLKRKLDLIFATPNGVRVDHLDKEILILMKRAGFYSISFAIESGSQQILNRVNKKINLKIVPRMVQTAKKLGFQVPAYFMLGLPGETYQTARQTIQFAKKLPIDNLALFLVQPLPGSKHFQDLFQNSNIKTTKELMPFYTFKKGLKLTDGKNTMSLPKDAIREFYLRPIQVYRSIRRDIKLFNFRQLFFLLGIVLRTIL